MVIVLRDLLGLGKVSKEVFERSVASYLPLGKIELDGATINLSENTVIAHSPSIGVPVEALGFFVFHYAASNVASRFGKPEHMITGIYLPLETEEKDLKTITKGIGAEAKKFGVKVIAGQTATYYGLKIPLITGTCLGEQVRAQVKPQPGDHVVLIGEVGGETVWLKELSEGVKTEKWRSLTPLPIILGLQSCEHVKMMHDVSEGGVIGGLLEIVDYLGTGIDVHSSGINYADGVDLERDDPLCSPSYGALIAVVSEQGLDIVNEICLSTEVSFSDVGVIKKTPNLMVDNKEVTEHKRVELDKLYGSLKIKDEVITKLDRALRELVKIPRLSGYIPQVGMNMVFCGEDAKRSDGVAGLSGRIVRSMGEPLICGEVAYGASSHLASVVLEAKKLDESKLSAINLGAGDDVILNLRSLGLRVKVLPSDIRGKECPVTLHLREANMLLDAYVHPGSFGVEPTTTIIGSNPDELVNVLKRLTYVE